MAITVVGTASASAIDGGDPVIDLTAITGLAENDVVYIFGGFPRNSVAGGVGVSSLGWTRIAFRELNPSVALSRKVMGATPDTSATCKGTANAADEVGYVAVALRGVNATPEDATTTESNGGGASVHTDGPAIDTVTDGALVMSMFGRGGNGGTIAAPTGYTNLVSVQPSADTNTWHAALASKIVTAAGTEDPGVWASSTGFGQWTFTAAVRPAADTGRAARIAHYYRMRRAA